VNVTDQATLKALQAEAIDGVVTVSVRYLAERIGRTKGTASASLIRLIKAGRIELLRKGKGLQPNRYRMLPDPENLYTTETTTQTQEPTYEDVRDLFRSPDLYGAGQLWDAAPKGVPVSVAEILTWGITRSRGGVMGQLVKLESLPAPLAEGRPDPAHQQRKLWTFLELTLEAELRNLEHLDTLDPQYRPRYRLDQELRHLTEQEQNRAWRGFDSYSVVVDRDIMPYVFEDPETGCRRYERHVNSSGYGTVYAEHYGIGNHRIVWIVERGPVPAGHELHHECRVRSCVNVNHLIAVTRAEHIRIHQAMGLTVDEC
jgi:hypothetical protein